MQQSMIPLLSEQAGRSAFADNGNLTHIPGISPTNNTHVPVDKGVPGVLYAHNVIPSTYGYQAVGYVTEIASLGAAGIFSKNYLVYGSEIVSGEPVTSNLRTYMCLVESGGTNTLYFVNTAGNWQQVVNTPSLPTTTVISVATVNGYTYICIPNVGFYVFNINTGTLVNRTLAPLDIAKVRGLVSSNGYLIAWENDSVAWSSAVDVEDFEPSEISGAGAGSVQEATGTIVFAIPHQIGFYIFTTSNIVSVQYTGNESFPFEFFALAGSGGVFSEKLISRETVEGSAYAITTSGIQKIFPNRVSTELIAISDFLAGRVFEDYDENLKQFIKYSLNADMERAIEVIANRYIVISYSRNPSGDNFTHAIVVDALQGRIGKLKADHKRVLEFRNILVGTYLDNKGSLGLLKANGAIVRVDFALNNQNTSGVMICGKAQLRFNELVYLSEVHVENVNDNFSLYDLPSFDGKTLVTPVDGYEFPEDSGKPLRRYFFDNVAQSHTIVCSGGFDINTLMFYLSSHGAAN